MTLRSDRKGLIEDAELFETHAQVLEKRARDYRDIARQCREKAARIIGEAAAGTDK